MCGCEAGFTCSRCVPGRTLTGHADWRTVSLRELCDLGEWTDTEVAESRWEQHISTHDFDSPWKDAA